MELDAIAGVVVGGTSLAGGVGSVVGTIIGVFIMSVLKIGLPYIRFTTTLSIIHHRFRCNRCRLL